jgi:hypothetical protein
VRPFEASIPFKSFANNQFLPQSKNIASLLTEKKVMLVKEIK